MRRSEPIGVSLSLTAGSELKGWNAEVEAESIHGVSLSLTAGSELKEGGGEPAKLRNSCFTQPNGWVWIEGSDPATSGAESITVSLSLGAGSELKDRYNPRGRFGSGVSLSLRAGSELKGTMRSLNDERSGCVSLSLRAGSELKAQILQRWQISLALFHSA